MNDDELLPLCGGKPVTPAAAPGQPEAAPVGLPVWDFGYRPVAKTEAHQATRAEAAAADDPDAAPVLFAGNKVFLWLYLKLANGGTLPPLNWQWTGSCVNGGAQNCLMILQGIEVAMLRQPEAFKAPFTLAAYGQSRHLAYGDDSPGEGSDGNKMAEALRDYGTVAIADDPGVPKPYPCGPAFCYDRATELKWAGVSTHPAGLAERCKKHRLKSVPVLSADAAEQQLRRGRPLTWAGTWGGVTSCPLAGDPAVRLNRHASQWNHQQSVSGMWKHPSLGRIFYVQNQWYQPAPGSPIDIEMTYDGDGNRVYGRMHTPGPVVSVHGSCPNGEPEGGYWIAEDDMDWQCRHGDVNALYAYEGFDGPPQDP